MILRPVKDQHLARAWLRPALLGLAALCVAGSALAQSVQPALTQAAAELRDPTELPSVLRAAAAAPAGSSAASEAASALEIRQLVFVGGRAYVVSQGRRLGVGDRLGDARIERIDERAVWLRQGGVTRREPLFAGVEKSPPAGEATPSSAKTSRAAIHKQQSQPQAQRPAPREKP